MTTKEMQVELFAEGYSIDKAHSGHYYCMKGTECIYYDSAKICMTSTMR